MPKFRKKPVVIDAWRITTGAVIPDWLSVAVGQRVIMLQDGKAIIPTLEGVMTGEPGDWIIKGVKGEFYPCKADIFAATYEAVE